MKSLDTLAPNVLSSARFESSALCAFVVVTFYLRFWLLNRLRFVLSCQTSQQAMLRSSAAIASLRPLKLEAAPPSPIPIDGVAIVSGGAAPLASPALLAPPPSTSHHVRHSSTSRAHLQHQTAAERERFARVRYQNAMSFLGDIPFCTSPSSFLLQLIQFVCFLWRADCSVC